MFFRRKRPALSKTEVSTQRLEAFSDGVLAIVITIMILGLKVPQEPSPDALLHLWPVFLGYVVSFFFVAIYWINHHHLFHFVKHVDNLILWANLVFLFCLSLIPFSTAYVSASGLQVFPSMLYAAVMLLCSLAFVLLRVAVFRERQGAFSFNIMREAALRKNWLALFVYLLAIPAALIHPILTIALIFLLGLSYVLPSWEKHPFH